MPSAIPFPLHRTCSGNLYCIAELPAFAVFGARYQELLDEYKKRLKDPKRQKQLYEEMVSSQAKFKAEGLRKMGAHLEQLQNTDPKLFTQTASRLRAGLKMIAPFLSLFKQINKLPSAARAQMLRGLEEMERKIKAHYVRKAQKNIEQQFKHQPELAARMKREFADLVTSSPSVEAAAQHEGEPYSPGKVRLTFGKIEKPTSNQDQLFEWLLTHQDKVAKDVSEQLSGLYQALDQSRQDFFLDSDQEMLFPKMKTAVELHDFIRPSRISMDNDEPIIQCHFDTTWKDLFGDRPQGLRLIYYMGVVCSDGTECDPKLSKDLLKILGKKPELAYKL